MSGEAGNFTSFGKGPATVAFGTKIVLSIEPRRRKKTKLTNLVYTSAGTAHTLTVLRPLAFCTLTAAPAASQAVVNINRNPGAYAANALLDGLPVPSVADNLMAGSDYVMLELPDGNFLTTTVSSINSLAVTLAANVPTGGAKIGAKLWFFGVEADIDPNFNGVAHPSFAPTTSATTTYSNAAGGSLVETKFDHSPLLIISSNASATGIIQNAGGVYARP